MSERIENTEHIITKNYEKWQTKIQAKSKSYTNPPPPRFWFWSVFAFGRFSFWSVFGPTKKGFVV